MDLSPSRTPKRGEKTGEKLKKQGKPYSRLLKERFLLGFCKKLRFLVVLLGNLGKGRLGTRGRRWLKYGTSPETSVPRVLSALGLQCSGGGARGGGEGGGGGGWWGAGGSGEGVVGGGVSEELGVRVGTKKKGHLSQKARKNTKYAEQAQMKKGQLRKLLRNKK